MKPIDLFEALPRGIPARQLAAAEKQEWRRTEEALQRLANLPKADFKGTKKGWE